MITLNSSYEPSKIAIKIGEISNVMYNPGYRGKISQFSSGKRS